MYGLKFIPIIILFLVSNIYCVNICASTTASYDAKSFGFSCESSGGATREINQIMTSTNKVLKLIGNDYEYVDICSLSVSDVIMTIEGATTVTSNTPSSISDPEIINGDRYIFSRDGKPYKQVPTWLGLDKNTLIPYINSATTRSQSINTIGSHTIYTNTINFNEYLINTQSIDISTNKFNMAYSIPYGSSFCNGTLYNIRYYDSQQLKIPVFYGDFHDYVLVGTLKNFKLAIDSILALPNGLIFINDELIYEFTYTAPSCTSCIITTANGYITVNGLSMIS